MLKEYNFAMQHSSFVVKSLKFCERPWSVVIITPLPTQIMVKTKVKSPVNSGNDSIFQVKISAASLSNINFDSCQVLLSKAENFANNV